MSSKNKKKFSLNYDTVLTSTSNFQIVEAYKAIRTNLLFALSTTEYKAVIISSAEPDAGKSTTCANLAITMAQTGARVIIVDADMRKPVMHKIFKVVNNKGLSKILSALQKPTEGIYKDVVPNLDLITAGLIPPNPSELLGSERMKVLLEHLEQSYDYIFIDTPPINIVTDSLLLLDKVAGITLVARQRQTHYEELQKTIDVVHNVNGNLLGVIITDVFEKNKPYSNYKSYKYKVYDYEYKK